MRTPSLLRLANDLRGAGAAVWLDQADIPTGEHWDQAVERALVRCPRMILVLSPSSVGPVNVSDEVSFALEKGKVVLPVLYRDCEIPFRTRRLQHVDFRTDYDRGVKALLKDLSGPTARAPETAMHGSFDSSGSPSSPASPASAGPSPFSAIPAVPFLKRRAVFVLIPVIIVVIAFLGSSIASFLRRHSAPTAERMPVSSDSQLPAPIPEVVKHEAAVPSVAPPSSDAPKAQSNAARVHVPATAAPPPKPVEAETPPKAKKKDEIAARAAQADALWNANRFEEALPGETEACDAGVLPSCILLGNMYDYGRGVTQDQSRGIALYKKGCDGGYMSGCFILGQTYESVDAATQAKAAFQKGCGGHNANSCFALGQLFQGGKGVIPDDKRAYGSYLNGCNLKDAPSCYQLALMYESGAGTEIDLPKAAELYRSSCEATVVPACYKAGQAYELGRGVAIDRGEAANFYRKGCNLLRVKLFPSASCVALNKLAQ